MYSDNGAKVCCNCKSSRICCSAAFSYRMVSSFKLSI